MSIVDSYRIEDLVELAPTSLKGSWDMTDKTPRERLMALRDFLRTDIPNTCWDFSKVTCDPGCGTAGCAIGWYAYLTGMEDAVDFYAGEGNAFEGTNQHFQMPYEPFVNTFSYGLSNILKKVHIGCVTPSEVADAIDEYLMENKDA